MKLRRGLHRQGKWLLLLLALAWLITLAGGCGLRAKQIAAGGEAMPEIASDEVAREAASAPEAEGAGSTAQTLAALETMTGAEAAEGRKVIKTAQLNIEVEDLNVAQKDVQDYVEAAGGFIASLTVEKTSETRTDAAVVCRVPSDNFRQVYDKIKELGDVKHDQLGGQDVTEEYMDLQTRIENKRVELQRLREMFAQAKTVPDLLAVEQRLTEVQGEIEQLQGRMRYLKDQVGYSTITLSLYQLGEAPLEETGGWRLGYHIRGAWNGLVAAFRGLLIGLIYVIILGAVVWVPVLIIILWIRAALRSRHARRMAQMQAQFPPQQ